MTDRELLEAAAKAVNQPIEFTNGVPVPFLLDGELVPAWNPLTDDGDAFRLMVKLAITDLDLIVGRLVFAEGEQPDLCATTRRAIVRAAAMADSPASRT
jgi:hypothetical protein